MKNLYFSGCSFFQKKIADIWNFQWIKYLGKGLSYLKNSDVGVNYCLNYGPLKLLLCFIEYRLDQFNSKHTKTVVNSTIQCFEDSSWKKCQLKVWCFLLHTTKWRPCKILEKLNGNYLLMANIFKLHEYKTFSFNESA